MRGSIRLALVLLLAGMGMAQGQESQGTPQARAAFARGEAAFDAKQYQAAADAYREALKLDPAYAEAHSQYIFVTRSYLWRGAEDRAVARLEGEYGKWIKASPTVAAYHWAIADINFYKDPAKAETAAQRAVAIDPRFARAYQTLALFSEMRGDNAAGRDFLRQAAEASPADPQYLFYYARQVAKTDPVEGTRLSLQVVEKFPQHERAAQALYWLAADEERPEARIQYLERLRSQFSPEKFNWSESGMSMLFDAYAAGNPEKALELARDRSAKAGKDSPWPERVALQQKLVEAKALVAAGKGAEAKALLDDAKLPKYVNRVPLLLAKADALSAALGPRAAYDSLVEGVAKEPTDATLLTLVRHGSGAGMTEEQVRADLAARRRAAAKNAPAFTLDGYDGRKLSLADFKGKVVLLNFWYPG